MTDSDELLDVSPGCIRYLAGNVAYSVDYIDTIPWMQRECEALTKLVRKFDSGEEPDGNEQRFIDQLELI
ncbi:hypothetical protein J4E80_005729 [Alternaria sp. BMP 0032]|nr:hypothetical protein J4E80_005729 [Alternaria sp. BMP 0032]